MPTRKPPPNDEQLELFSAIFTDIASRDTRETMEFPFLSLSKRRRFKPIRYSANGVEVTVSGGQPHGIASIFDWDLMIWLISQIRQATDRGDDVSRKIRFSRYAYLKDARRHTGGDEYRRLESAVDRLKHTTVTTTIRSTNRRKIMFNWIEYADIERDEKGLFRAATVVLPEWVFDAACSYQLVLTIHPDYFLLKGGIERWLYRIVRKGAGTNARGWEWSLRLLHQRSGTTRKYKDFSKDVRGIIERGRLLDYELKLVDKNGQQHLHARLVKSKGTSTELVDSPRDVSYLRLDLNTYEKAKALAPGYDVYALETDWRRFSHSKGTLIQNPDAAFLAFCKTHAANNPLPSR